VDEKKGAHCVTALLCGGVAVVEGEESLQKKKEKKEKECIEDHQVCKRSRNRGRKKKIGVRAALQVLRLSTYTYPQTHIHRQRHADVDK
jgi:hypothetical protein